MVLGKIVDSFIFPHGVRYILYIISNFFAYSTACNKTLSACQNYVVDNYLE